MIIGVRDGDKNVVYSIDDCSALLISLSEEEKSFISSMGGSVFAVYDDKTISPKEMEGIIENFKESINK